MPVSCEPNDLMEAAKCFNSCIPPGMQIAVQTMLLARIAGGSMDPDVLMEQAKCFDKCIPKGFHPAIQDMLLCTIVNAT